MSKRHGRQNQNSAGKPKPTEAEDRNNPPASSGLSKSSSASRTGDLREKLTPKPSKSTVPKITSKSKPTEGAAKDKTKLSSSSSSHKGDLREKLTKKTSEPELPSVPVVAAKENAPQAKRVNPLLVSAKESTFLPALSGPSASASSSRPLLLGLFFSA